MRCSLCRDNAVINMRQHHLALCKSHYLDWFVAQTRRAIERYKMFEPQEHLLLAVSGGKDSLSLWDVLWRSGYSVDGLYIHLGIESEEHYSDASERFIRDFANPRGLKLNVVNIRQTYGESINEMSQRVHRGRQRPCSVCGMVKRHEMNRIARDEGYQVLLTAHNLDDEAAVLFGNTINWSLDLMQRQSPVLEASSGFARKVKPFCRFYERETTAYALLRGIPYIEEECPYADGSTMIYNKELLNRLEVDHPGSKTHFYLGFLKARKTGWFDQAVQDDAEGSLHICPSCGQSTTAPGECAFCRLVHPDQATSR